MVVIDLRMLLLLVKVMPNLIQSEVESSIHGRRIGPNAPVVSHMLFADDSFLFFKTSVEEASCIKEILKSCAEMSGQEINY